MLTAAAQVAGLSTAGAELIRDGSNALYRLSGEVVARVGSPGTADTARREVRLSHWLAESGVPVVQALAELPQPVVVHDRPVTWWRLLPAHRPATPAELAAVLRTFHALPTPPEVKLPFHAPFLRLDERIAVASGLTGENRSWLVARLAELREQYERLSTDRPRQLIHGDAWQGNVAVPGSGPPILLDLEKVALGHPEWDLAQIAVDYTDFSRLTAEDYRSFVDAYGGHDLTKTAGYRTYADIQAFRWLGFLLGKSGSSAAVQREIQHRIACLRGEIPRPWAWTAF